MNHQLFYKELGRLLYAIAAADGVVQDKEVATLKRVVKEQLVPTEPDTDHFGSDQAFIAEYEFDVLADRNAEADGCFNSFIAYISQHLTELTPELRGLIERMADAVADSFHGTNKSELGYLIELRKELAKATQS
ncbi:MAG: hypothetical protein H6595_08875 [Flavobacteriales bacterium]|nr:hypothetical protein [Flavobacteriales bacterium]MCB9167580.1 hypothetical protein [Flavobacteriales bacterium]